MAVAYENSLAPVSVVFALAGETETVAFDAGSGSNRVLLVCVQWRDNADRTLSGVTYNGVAMTSLGAKVPIGTAIAMQLWSLANPASGSNNIAVTMAAGSDDQAAGISAWVGNGADVSGASVDGYTTNTGSASTASVVSSVTVTSAADDRVVVFFGELSDDDPMTATAANYTERQDAAITGAGDQTFGDAAGAASIAATATWSNGGGNSVQWVAFGVNVKAASVGGGGSIVMNLQIG